MARSFASIAGQAVRTADGKADSRKRLMGAVRAAAGRLGLEDDDRKAIQGECVPRLKDKDGKASLADMTLAEIGKVLDRLNRDQKDRGLGGSATHPHIAKVRALWWSLYWLGEHDDPNDRALDSFVRRQTGLAALRFLDHRHAPSVIEALKARAERRGVTWPTQMAVDQIAGMTMQQLERHAVLGAIWAQLYSRRIALRISPNHYLASVLGISETNQWSWTNRELDEAIRHCGRKLRTAIARERIEADA